MNFKKIISLIIVAVMLVALVACNNAPTYTAQEELDLGYKISGSHYFKVNITQGNYEYDISGNYAGDDIAISEISVKINGLTKSYKNIAYGVGDDLYINLNTLMNAVENQSEFLFYESEQLNYKYLFLEGGNKMLQSLKTLLQEKLNPSFMENIANGSQVDIKGYDYSFMYTWYSESAIQAIEGLAGQIDELFAPYVSNEDFAEAYKLIREESIGTHIVNLFKQELEKLHEKEVISVWSYTDTRVFEAITKIEGNYITVKTLPDETIQAQGAPENIITYDSFSSIFLTNVKDNRGFAYEYDEFLWTKEVGTNSLTLTRDTDLFKEVLTFYIDGMGDVRYKVDYTTYDADMHTSLKHWYNSGYTLITDVEPTDTLSGRLIYEKNSVESYYAACKTPRELEKVVAERGVPKY